MFKLGLIINPYAGIGGSVALKGSDGAAIVAEALARGASLRAPERAKRALIPLMGEFCVYGFSGAMAGDVAQALGYHFVSVGAPAADTSTAGDTCRAARALRDAKVDLIVFAGGDGTARLMADTLDDTLPVLGIPAGVKIHSGVYAITPEAVTPIVQRLLNRQWLPLASREVRDIDEQAFREGHVRARHYGDLLVPEQPEHLQQVKNAGAPVDELQQLDVAAELIERLDEQRLYIVGPGSTTHVFLQELGLEGTLLGVDLLVNSALVQRDVTAEQIRQAIAKHRGPVSIVVTAIGGQGHIFGRGNQQLAADIIANVGRENICVIATAEKVKALQGRPLLVDTNDPVLDNTLKGFLPVITGYQQQILYPVE